MSESTKKNIIFEVKQKKLAYIIEFKRILINITEDNMIKKLFQLKDSGSEDLSIICINEICNILRLDAD